MRKSLAVAATFLLVLMATIFVSSNSFKEHRARAFSKAAGDGNLWAMRLLRIMGANPGDQAPGRNPALLEAVENGRVEVIQYLLQAGVNINQKDKFGATSLIVAANAGQVETI